MQESGRRETPTERADRKWNDMLQELRVIQTGVQLTAGFLLFLMTLVVNSFAAVIVSRGRGRDVGDL